MNKQIEEAADKYALESFIPLRNKEGDLMTLPPAQSTPHGFTKHRKVAVKHFIAGANYAHEQNKETIQELVKALEMAKNGFLELANEGKYPESFMQDNGGKGLSFITNALQKAKQ